MEPIRSPLLQKLCGHSSTLFEKSQYQFHDCKTATDFGKALHEHVSEASKPIGQYMVPNTVLFADFL